MWPFRRKLRQRQVRVRRRIPATALSAWRRFRQAGGVGSSLLVAAFYLTVVLMDAWPTAPLPYRTGQYIPADIYARVPFKVLSPALIHEAHEKARRTTPAAFELNAVLVDKLVSTIQGLPDRLKAATQPAGLEEALVKEFDLSSEQDLAAWRSCTQPADKTRFEAGIERLRASLAETVILRPDEIAAEEERSARDPEQSIFLVQDAGSKEYRLAKAISQADREGLERAAARLAGFLPPPIQKSVKSYLVSQLKVRPTYRYDKDRTQRDIDAAIEVIDADPPREWYQAQQRLVLGSGKQGLSAGQLELLAAEQEEFLRLERTKSPWRAWGRLAGRVVILLVVTALLCLYVVHHQRQILKNHWRAFAIITVLLLMLGVNKVMHQVLNWNPHAAVLPVLMATIILTIAYDQRFALMLGLALSVLVVLQLRADFALFVVLLAGVTASAFQLREIRTRSKLIRVASLTAAVVFASCWAAAMLRAVPWRFALFDSLWAVGFAILVGFLIQGILPLIERLFRTVTSMTLLEWCDASKPLLKRLAMEAPGTYNHCLQLGAMCETAAETIAARGLLTRVGAYYHDIGKVNKPDYFVENQSGAASKHAKLSPAMSLLVIIGHIKDGLEMARKYGLPPILREFIAAHHGTTLVQYFYQAATEQRKAETGRAPDEVEFRYPGPKPRSKEVAILMLADAAESSVRAMSEPTPGRIENQVHTMVNRRLMDGQLDECDLTLKEVHQIETSLIKSLCGIYHARIAYPAPAGQEASAAETPAGKDREAADSRSPERPEGGKPTAE